MFVVFDSMIYFARDIYCDTKVMSVLYIYTKQCSFKFDLCIFSRHNNNFVFQSSLMSFVFDVEIYQMVVNTKSTNFKSQNGLKMLQSESFLLVNGVLCIVLPVFFIYLLLFF